MKILLVAATASEIRPFTGRLVPQDRDKGKLRHFLFNETSIDVLVTGIGMIPTAFYLGKYLPEGNYDMAINAGICGSYKKELPPGTVAEVTEDFPAELGAEENGSFRTIFALGLDSPDEWPWREGKLVNAFPVNHPALEQLKKVKGATVGTLGRNPDQLKMITDAFDPAVETMEGAAFLYCCLSQRIPSIQLRAVSNFVGEMDRTKWQVELAVRRLNDVLGDVVRW